MYYHVSYGHQIDRHFTLLGSFSRYPIATSFIFYKENEGGSIGWNGINTQRYAVGIKYNIFTKGNFIIQPNIGFGIQKSLSRGVGIISDIPDGIKPDFF